MSSSLVLVRSLVFPASLSRTRSPILARITASPIVAAVRRFFVSSVLTARASTLSLSTLFIRSLDFAPRGRCLFNRLGKEVESDVDLVLVLVGDTQNGELLHEVSPVL